MGLSKRRCNGRCRTDGVHSFAQCLLCCVAITGGRLSSSVCVDKHVTPVCLCCEFVCAVCVCVCVCVCGRVGVCVCVCIVYARVCLRGVCV